MARVKGANKMGFTDGYEKYDTSNGFGTPQEWREAFYERMGFEQAQQVREEAQRRGTWRSEHRIIEASGTTISDSSLWDEVKAAFRKAALNTHPDRANLNGMTNAEAQEKFKEVQAAFAILERRYGK
jgi:hypothetical protein